MLNTKVLTKSFYLSIFVIWLFSALAKEMRCYCYNDLINYIGE